jgi:prophage tail gpP-like protein
MSEQAPNVFQKTELLPDAVTLFVDKKVFEGWEDVQITRELNSAASDFQLQVTDKWREDQEPWRITAGQAVHLHIGKKSILTGYVDKVSSSVSAASRTVTISGRSSTADIVDCSVVGDSFTGLNLKQLAEKLCAPFKIPVSFIGEAGAEFPAIKVQPGETVFALLEKHTKQRKVLMMPSKEGGLIFTTAGTSRASTHLKLGENVLSGSSDYDYTNRFSQYEVKGQDIGFLTPGEKSTSPLGKATDAGISRFRPLVILNETTTDDGKSEDRASYEASLRKAQSLKVNIEVQGWFQKDGTLWDINQLTQVDCGFLGVRRQMLIRKITYNKSNNGTTAQIELCLPDSFDFKKAKKKEDPLGWAKPL